MSDNVVQKLGRSFQNGGSAVFVSSLAVGDKLFEPLRPTGLIDTVRGMNPHYSRINGVARAGVFATAFVATGVVGGVIGGVGIAIECAGRGFTRKNKDGPHPG